MKILRHLRCLQIAESLSKTMPYHIPDLERALESVTVAVGLGIRRGMTKMGRALNLWSHVHNLLLWGELRGQGRMVMYGYSK